MTAELERPASATAAITRGPLTGIRVVELADEQAEYCGLALAGLGADVVKVEPPGGSPTRRIGPFYRDREDPERSLFFWQYNRGKRSIVLDLREREDDRARFRALVTTADVLLDSTPRGELDAVGLGSDELMQQHPALIVARVSPFGDHGPWVDWKGSDLVHLALGGVMMNCGYDPAPGGKYDLPPIAPQMWHAYHVAGEQLTVAIVAALLYRWRTGKGQRLSCAVHEAVAKSTEVDLMSWVMRRAPVLRQTCRHARESVSPHPSIVHTKDGRWVMANLGTRAGEGARLISLLERYGMAAGLDAEQTAVPQGGRFVPGTGPDKGQRDHAMEAVQRFVRAFTYENVPWREAQEAGMLWAPLRKPHENALDPHWLARGSCTDVEHPELGRSFRYATSKWIATGTSWSVGRRAPLLNEDAESVMLPRPPDLPVIDPSPRTPVAEAPSRLGKPFPLHGIRILDFTWFLASAGGTRFMSAFGAECIKVELKSHPDTRMAAMAPIGGREARERATAPLAGVTDPDMGGQFNNKNPGKRGISLNVRHPKGLEIARRLVGLSDIVAEGFSPGVLDSWGLGYEAMRSIKPDIIYVQQSGMGAQGKYGRFRTVGPIANSFAGLSEMSGLPEPAMPAGWGYSYLDWMGAYSFALAMLTALFHRERTGEGQWIDASQSEVGLFISGTTILDWSANERVWSRFGNRSPFKKAAPHGAYPCQGEDRWLAIACFTEAEWRALAQVAERPQWTSDPRFADLAARLAHQDALDAAVADWTRSEDAYQVMLRLQQAGVSAGVCQMAEDRCDHDPQLAALSWLTEVTGTKIGRWPIAEVPVKMSESPAYIGGRIDRGAPCYGEDNHYVYGELLGMSTQEIEALAADGVI